MPGTARIGSTLSQGLEGQMMMPASVGAESASSIGGVGWRQAAPS